MPNHYAQESTVMARHKQSGKKYSKVIMNGCAASDVVGVNQVDDRPVLSADSMADHDNQKSNGIDVVLAETKSLMPQIAIFDGVSAGNSPLDMDDGHAILISSPVHDRSATTAPESPEASRSKSHGNLESRQSPVSNREKFLSHAISEVAVPPSPSSPGSNRNRFMANCQPLQVSCDLATVGMHNNAVRFSFQAVVLVVYPATKGPDRRHVQLIDSKGSTGITIWNDNVRLFDMDRVGEVVKFTKLCIVFNNGKKSLSMGRDSTVTFVNTVASPCEESKWWQSLLMKQHLRICDVHDCNDDVLINVAGIIGMLTTERKRVRDQDRDLLCIRLTDRTGYIDIRSWTHCELEFARFLEKPLLMQRVRVTSFAGIKILELLAGPGTVLLEKFPGQVDLEQYWLE